MGTDGTTPIIKNDANNPEDLGLQALLNKADGIANRIQASTPPSPAIAQSQVKPLAEETKPIIKSVADMVGKGASFLGRGVSGLAQGIGKGYLEGIANIPHALMSAGSMLSGLPSGPEDVETQSSEPGSPRPDVPSLPYVRADEMYAGIRALPSIRHGGEEFLKTLEQEKQAQKEYGDWFLPAAVTIGEWLPAIEGLWGVTKLGTGVAIKAGSKIPIVKTGIEKVEKGLAGLAKRASVKSGMSEAAVDQALSNADKLKDFRDLGDRYLSKKADTFAELVDDFREMRNKVYEKSMDQLLPTVKNMPVQVEGLGPIIQEAKSAETISPALKKYLTAIEAEIKGKPTLRFERVNEIKKTLGKEYAGFERAEYIGRTADDEIIARRAYDSLARSLEDVVPEIKPINAKYSTQSVVLKELRDIVGKREYRIDEAGKKVPWHKRTYARLDRSMEPGSPNMQVLDDFASQYPEAAPTIQDIRNYIVAKKIYQDAQLGGRAIVGGSGVRGVASIPASYMAEKMFEVPLGLYGDILRTKRGPWINLPKGGRVGTPIQKFVTEIAPVTKEK